MRRQLEIVVRACLRPLPLCGGTVLILVAALTGWTSVSSDWTTIFYVLALCGAAVSLVICGPVDRAVVARPTMAWHATAMLFTWLLALAPVALVAAIGLGRGLDAPHTPVVLGTLHVAALAHLACRLPGSDGIKCLIFVISAGPVPALFPLLGPLLDASPSFRAEHFPPWTEAFAPILTLVVIAFAVPPHHAAPVGGPST